MSTFGGLMKEYRLISLDRFDGINLKSTVYMLSHNHSGKNIGAAAVFVGRCTHERRPSVFQRAC